MKFKKKRLNKRYSKKLFSRTASRVHRRNAPSRPLMRGGIRM